MSYAWQGEVIRLNQKDYDKFKRNYPSVDLDMELQTLDMEFQYKPPKNWFVPTLKKLAYQERMAVSRKPKPEARKTRDIPLKERLTDRSWAS